MKRLAGLLCALALALCLAGCSAQAVAKGCDSLLKLAGEASLSPDLLLKGRREKGDDGYTGTYDADYQGFSGTETLLGGTTALDTRRVTVRCTVAAREGSLKLVLERGTEKEVLLDGMGSCEKELTLESGSNYLCAVGEDFTGTLDLDVANAPAQRENTAPKGPSARP